MVDLLLLPLSNFPRAANKKGVEPMRVLRLSNFIRLHRSAHGAGLLVPRGVVGREVLDYSFPNVEPRFSLSKSPRLDATTSWLCM